MDVRLLAIGTHTCGKRKGAEVRDPVAEDLLKRFYEGPDDLDWQELLKQSQFTEKLPADEHSPAP